MAVTEVEARQAGEAPARTGGFTYFIKVFGCQMNVADANDLELTLRLRGGVPAGSVDDADLVLVNTCVVRKKAEDKAYSYIGTLKDVKDKNPGAFLAVMGCLVPKSREFVEKRFKFVDLLVDYSSPDVVVEALDNSFEPMRAEGAGHRAIDALTADPRILSGGMDVDSFLGAPEISLSTAMGEIKKSGLVTIIRGCNYRCTFCIVPSVRGREVSIPPEVIAADVRRKHEAGYRMITLLGQNVMTYGNDREECPDFRGLIDKVLTETDVPWLHFLTSHPRDLSDEFVENIYSNKRMMESLHLPFQSGSNSVLKRMGRRHTCEYYLSRVEKVREARPDIFLSTDVIVGFPGETRGDFEDTLDVISRVRFNDAFMFKYSAREGTPATRLPSQVPEEEKKGRLKDLIALQREIGREENGKYVGRKFRALIEGENEDGRIARLPINKPVLLKGCGLPAGEFVEVEITGVRNSTFDGKMPAD